MVFQHTGRIVATVLTLFVLLGATHSIAGTLNNRAHATGSAPGGGAVSSAPDEVQLNITPKDPEYTVNKSVAVGTVGNGTDTAAIDAAGDTLVYSIVVANTGNVSLDIANITDPGPTFGGILHTGTYALPSSPYTPTSGDTDTDGELDVGESWTYQITYTLTQADVDNAVAGGGVVENTVALAANDQQAIAATLDPLGSDLTASITITPTSDMTVDKTAVVSTDGGLTFAAMGPTQTLNAGDIVRYSYLVANTGDTTITGISIAEDLFNGTGGTGVIHPTGTIASLAPGGTGTLVAPDYEVLQADIDNLQ